MSQATLSHEPDARPVAIGSVGMQDEQPERPILALGPGWAWPAAFLALFITLFILPAHHAGGGGGDGLVAAAGTLYAVGLSVVAPRLVRGVILRLAGSREPIVILGIGADPLADVAIRPRWRLAAIGAGMLLSTAAAVGSVALLEVADPTTYGHAVASIALGVNVLLAAAILVPVPGFAGWALLLAIVEATGTPADQRVRRAVRIAQAVGFPLFLAFGMGAALLGDPMLMLLGFLLAMFTWTRTDVALGHDLIGKYLASHVAGDLARPASSHADADELVADLASGVRAPGVVTLVETSGALVGAIGPRQLAARDQGFAGQRCSEVMVPLTRAPLLAASAPASALLALIGRHGFALVRDSDGLSYVESADLLARLQSEAAERDP